MLESRKATYQAIYFVPNGLKIFDIWSQREIEDKNKISLKGGLNYKTNNNNSTYNSELIKLIQELKEKHEGFTNLSIMEGGRLLNTIRISKVDKTCPENWDQVIEKLCKYKRS